MHYDVPVKLVRTWIAYTSKNSSFFLPTSFTFSDDDFSMETELGQSKVKWNGVIAYKVVAGYYLLYLSTITLTAISKKAFSPEDTAAFENLLHDKTGH